MVFRGKQRIRGKKRKERNLDRHTSKMKKGETKHVRDISYNHEEIYSPSLTTEKKRKLEEEETQEEEVKKEKGERREMRDNFKKIF